MRINPNSLHVKMYILASWLFAAWKEKSPPEFTFPIHSNLCPYVRRLLITLPLLLLSYASVIYLIFEATLIFPVAHFGWKYFALIGSAMCTFGAILGMSWCLATFFPKIWRFLKQYIGYPVEEFFIYVGKKTEQCILGKPDAPTFCAVVRQWALDMHHHLCRSLVIGEEEGE